jgi:[citrate (pro-3S)-lyase] ligase
MTTYTFKDVLLPSEIDDVKNLLKINNLTYEDTITKTIGLYDQKRMVATGSIDHNVIKMIAVDPDYTSRNLSSKILSYLLFDMEANQFSHYFLFTKPENKKVFNSFNFNEVIETKDVVLYENKEKNITQTLQEIKKTLPPKKGIRNCIVMNLNPMTLGHLHLIEKATPDNGDLIIFLVETNASKIDYKTRYNILKKTISHFKNIHILPSTDYIISRATFPTYFLKDEQRMEVYTQLDVSIFKQYFMPIFEIDMRFVGQEPLDPLTDAYNKTLKDILGSQLTIIKRLTLEEKVISASYVRLLARQKKFDELKLIVPHATFKFIISKKGRALFDE